MSSAANPHTTRLLAGLSKTILLAGAGKMGGAMLDAWVALGLSPANVVVLEPQPSPDIAALTERGVRLNPPRDSVGDIAAAVLAVKPQIAPEVLTALAPFVAGATVVLSIMAGRTLRFLADNLPGAALVRAMPNTPAESTKILNGQGGGSSDGISTASTSKRRKARWTRSMRASENLRRSTAWPPFLPIQ